ncbi:GPI ethanolamine phosphate transferase 1, partial [Elysia marginata]
MEVWQLVVSGVVVHIILFYSIFDIYFTSPLVHGMTPITVPAQAPASRLVLFVADGLRADKFFEPDENGKSRVPYLRKVIEEEGVWGVSHTRVPTESRPGHVAMIAGFYEDVSAVAKGWKENPVDFDSVFNQSRHTWSWGSPDILPMFSKGASGDHVITNCYPADLEDFAGSDMTRLDTWVFDQVKNFFGTASRKQTLYEALHQDKIIMFMHLLGIDTHGHANKPHSKEYLNNIRVVDKGIKEIVELVNDFYENDGQTVFVLTADHGMTDWGSHGAGHPQETLTPFLAWGPGVRQPVVQENCGKFPDSFCADWHLNSIRRCDMEQADIAPLMAYLIGVALPVNSVGVLPIDVLSAGDPVKAEALFANAKQLLAQFQVKAVKHIQHLIDKGRSQDAILESHDLIRQALQGLRYYQTYDRLFLGTSIVLGFLGWMSYILHLVLAEHTSVGRQAFYLASSTEDTGYSRRSQALMESASLSSFRGSTIRYGILMTVCTTIVLLLYVQSLPLMYYVYCLLPTVLLFKSFQGWSMLGPAIRSMISTSGCPWSLLLSCICCLAGLEIIVQSFYRRELLSLGLLAMSAWPFLSWAGTPSRSRQFAGTFSTTSCGWSLSCLLVAVFPLLPVVGRNSNYELV